MKSKQVWRYYCEFCGKANCSKPSIEKHERRCTLNPNRECGVCKLMHKDQPKIDDLLASLPKRPTSVPMDEDGMGFTNRITEEEMKKIRDAAGNCPACIMAALRQYHIPVPCAFDFDFRKEVEKVWNDFWIEENALESEPYY